MANLHQLLKAMIEKGASDLHITTGSPPQLRVDGRLVPLKMPPLSATETRQICYSILAYGNDWDEQLATRAGFPDHSGGGYMPMLSNLWRLPIIGFDTATVWDWQTYSHTGYIGSDAVALGGAAFVMRDYLKNVANTCRRSMNTST